MSNRVRIIEGEPDLRSAQPLTQALGMTLSVTLEVPRGLNEEQARAFINDRLQRAATAVPELSFTAVIGRPDL